MNCPLCERPDVRLERHHLQTRRKDRVAIEKICVECHKTIHGLFSQRELRDARLMIDSIDDLLINERFIRALGFIRKLSPGTSMPMRQARSRRRR